MLGRDRMRGTNLELWKSPGLYHGPWAKLISQLSEQCEKWRLTWINISKTPRPMFNTLQASIRATFIIILKEKQIYARKMLWIFLPSVFCWVDLPQLSWEKCPCVSFAYTWVWKFILFNSSCQWNLRRENETKYYRRGRGLIPSGQGITIPFSPFPFFSPTVHACF